MNKEVRVGVVGVGNCANSLMQGLTYYAQAEIPCIGLVRPKIGSYSVADIKVVAAFDVVEGKVGADLATAIWTHPNDTFKFAEVPEQGVIVQRGPTLDGLGIYLRGWVKEDETSATSHSVVAVLKAAGVEVLINYLPVGSEQAARMYAETALEAGCSFVNCMPAFIASDPRWAQRFYAQQLPIVGDDIKSQVGATIVHRVLASLFHDRGVQLDRTYQLNVGGNGDFKNMLERERLVSKKLSKTEAVVSVAGVDMAGRDVHIGPSDYIEWLGDRKIAYIRLEGRGFGGAPLTAEVKLEVWDSPNSAGIVIDAVRCAKLAMDRGEAGPVQAVSTYFMKRPPNQVEDSAGLIDFEAWLSRA